MDETSSLNLPVTGVPSSQELVRFATETDDEVFDAGLIALMVRLLENENWRARLENERSLEFLPLITAVPMICKGSACKYSPVCPVLKQLKGNTSAMSRLVGSQCRVDKLEISALFLSLIPDLNITPNQFSDVMSLLRLVRNYVLLRRATWDISIDGMMIEEVGAVIQKTGDVVNRDVEHPLQKTISNLEKDIGALNKELVASRKDRIAAASAFGGVKDLVELFTGAGKGLKDRPRLDESLDDDVIDAVFTDGDE